MSLGTISSNHYCYFSLSLHPPRKCRHLCRGERFVELNPKHYRQYWSIGQSFPSIKTEGGHVGIIENKTVPYL